MSGEQNNNNGGGADRMLKVYERFMDSAVMQDYYGQSNFNNVGLWDDNTKTQDQACVNLMNTLTAKAPPDSHKILDVACGTGGTTHFLSEHFSSTEVTGINISAHQLHRCRLNYPLLNFIEMDATDLRFPDETFDLVFCAEAAFHFNPRAKFIAECNRVLKKNGMLVLCDILLNVDEALNWFLPPANAERTVDNYEKLLKTCGFSNITINDKTSQTCAPYATSIRKWAISKKFFNQISEQDYNYLLSLPDLMKKHPVRFYLFINAEKK